MTYRANVIKVMIASPGDVATERQIIREVLFEWNSMHSEDKELVLMPIGWDTHSPPQMGDRPQAIINKRILKDCDLLVAVFWTRVGTPTGKSASGTIEEIEEHLAAGKPAMLYFSSAPVRIESVDDEQYHLLQEFKKQFYERGLVQTYDSISDFKEKFSRHIAQTINYDDYFAEYRKHSEPEDVKKSQTNGLAKLNLSDESKQLLKDASLDKNGMILKIRTISGLEIGTNGKNFVDDSDPRSEAKWESAMQELLNNVLIQDRGSKGEVFGLTNFGYKIADSITI
jgi:hypothetical protein